MFSSDKRASLDSGLLAAKEPMPSSERDAESAAPPASLFALPRGGARQRLIAAAQSASPNAAESELAAGGADTTEAVPPEPPAPSERESVLYSKGDASASGFRPWYWSYERDGGPALSDSTGTVTRFPASAPSPVSLPDPVSAPAISDPAPRRGARLALALLAGVSTLALAGAATLFILSRAETSRDGASAPVVIARALPMAAPAPPPPKPAMIPALPKAVGTPARAAAAPHGAELAELMARGDQMLATGDIAAARLFYERAAEGGSAAAARQAGKTYDPLFLAEARARGIRGDPVAAARWYRTASAGGDTEADALMKRLMAKYAG
jgi:hypothetical protein